MAQREPLVIVDEVFAFACGQPGRASSELVAGLSAIAAPQRAHDVLDELLQRAYFLAEVKKLPDAAHGILQVIREWLPHLERLVGNDPRARLEQAAKRIKNVAPHDMSGGFAPAAAAGVAVRKRR